MAHKDVRNLLPEGNFDASVFPLGECVDRYHEAREIRLAMEKEMEAQIAVIKDLENSLHDHIIAVLRDSEGTTGVAGKKYRAQLVTKRVPKVTDWGEVYAWVRQYNRFDLLQKRLSDKAVTDMWDNEETVPGIEPAPVLKISVTKI